MKSTVPALSGRRSGVLLPVTALPGERPVGDFGVEIDRWLGWLADGAQRVWQVLPLGTTTAYAGHSPYSSLSAFAIDPVFIDLDSLVDDGLLQRWSAPAMEGSASRVDYAAARELKAPLFERAFEAWRGGGGSEAAEYREFVRANEAWLPDYALFAALRSRFESAPWFDWEPELRDRQPEAIDRLRREEAPRVEIQLFLQYVADRQWRSIRARAAELDIEVFGDLPIYVSWDSADVWQQQALFDLDDEGRPTVVAGVPPDYFSETGQRWGNPLYRWDRSRREAHRWWIERLRRNTHLFDLVRLDHFRAFQSYWEIPAAEPDAVNGRWVRGAGQAFFRSVRQSLPDARLVAEDLGVITDDVRRLRRRVGLPGMRVLQFGFGGDFPRGEHLLHRLTKESILYTGTHDNNTLVGWFENDLSEDDRKQLESYVGQEVTAENVHLLLGRLAFSAVPDLVVLPLQDVLGLGGDARTNRPGEAEGNWLWRAHTDQLATGAADRLRGWAETYARTPEPEVELEEGAVHAELEPDAGPDSAPPTEPLASEKAT